MERMGRLGECVYQVTDSTVTLALRQYGLSSLDEAR